MSLWFEFGERPVKAEKKAVAAEQASLEKQKEASCRFKKFLQ